MKKQFFIIDTSALLSGKNIDLGDANMITTPGVSAELKQGGRDYRLFQLLLEKGLSIQSPSRESIDEVIKTSAETGDKNRLSTADIEILALALDLRKDVNKEAVILTDDYSIQNVANTLNIKFLVCSQRGITKKFKWVYRCPGCGKQLRNSEKICPICGTEAKLSVDHKEQI